MASHRPAKAERFLRNRIARAVFEAAEAMGIADRELTEKLTEEVLQRLGQRSQPLPGLEGLAPRTFGPPSPSEVRSLLQELLTEKGAAKEPGPPPALESRIEIAPPSGDGLEARISPNARAVLERRYLQKDAQGLVMETVADLFRRVAHNIASADLHYHPQADTAALEEEFYRMMAELEFLPNSPTLMNAGRELQQLSACFVLPVEDSMESIFDAVKYTALIHKSGGGTGFSFSRLRPEKDRVGSTGGVASGPVSFMRAFDTATDVIKQGGMRRGANMAILNVEHPDIEKFVTAKEDNTSLQNFNLSVAVTESFMKAVEADAEYDLVNPRTKESVRKLPAREVFDKIVAMAWKNGDPGIVFLDRINRDNPTPHLGSIESTNPCGEQPLLPYESCNLGSINLSLMMKEKKGKTTIDWDKLEKRITLAIRFLDNVIDMNRYPIPLIEEKTKATRKIGLGVMGFADMLIRLGIPYNSSEALEVAERLMTFIDEKATEASADLAQERGVFPAFQGSIYDAASQPRVRNATRTTIAPTGTLSIIANCSSGIEPLYALSYVRNILDNARLVEVHPIFDETSRREGFWGEDLMRYLADGGSLRDREEVPEGVKKVFITALEISPEWHVRMQAAFQRHIDNAVSKTVNFPFEAMAEDVARVYMLAYQEGCKGITIYRDRSREVQVLTTGKAKPGEAKALAPRTRPVVTRGRTERVSTGCGNLYVTVNSDDRGICEVFSTLGKAGGCASGQLEAICRLISLCLRSGVDAASVVKHLKGIRCPSIAWDQGHAVLSCADAIGGVLERATNPEAVAKGDNPNPPARNLAGQCPECSSLLVYQEGCLICRACGYTKCG